MPAYVQLATFKKFVLTANPTFQRVKASSLAPLLAVLANVNGTAQQVGQAIAALPVAKVNRYLDALYYLLATYPGLPNNAVDNLHLGPLNQTAAVFYTQTAVPANYAPGAVQAQRVLVVPPSVARAQTIEQFLFHNRMTTGIVLIHLSAVQPGMENVYNGRTTLAHMTSVLQDGRLLNCPVCVLTMDNANNLCHPLLAEYNSFANRTRVYEHGGHMGGISADFRNFAAARANLVVMGFDACVCVFANVFGANERMPPNNAYRPPLISMANVVMSRAALVTRDRISSTSRTMGEAEYGPLFNT